MLRRSRTISLLLSYAYALLGLFAIALAQSGDRYVDEATSLVRQDKLEQAIEVLEAGINHAKRRSDSLALLKYRVLRASLCSRLGLVMYQSGIYSAAENHLRKSLQAARELQLPQQERDELINLSCVYLNLGRIGNAFESLEKAEQITRRFPDAQGEAVILLNRGVLCLNVAEYAKALRNLSKALAIQTARKDRNGIPFALANLGNVYNDLGDHAAAISFGRRALEAFKEAGNQVAEEQVLAQVAEFYSSAGDNESAIKLYREVLGRHDGTLASAVHQLSAGGRTDQKSGQLIAFATDILKKNYEPRILAEIGIANVHLAQGRFPEAVKKFADAGDNIGVGRCYLASSSYRMAKAAFGRSSNVASDVGLGLGEEGLKNYDAAKEHFKKAVETMESQREQLAPNDRRRFLAGNVFGFRRLEAYEGLVRVQRRLGQPEQAFYWSEHTKARSLMEALSQDSHDSRLGLPSSLRQREQDLMNRIAANRKQADQTREKQNTELQTSLEQQLKQLKRQQQELVAQLRQQHPEYAAMQYPTPLQASELALKDNEVLIAYEVTDPVTLAFVLRQGRLVKVVEIKISRKELRQQVEDYRRVFVEIGQTGSLTAFSKLDVKLGYRLYELLLKDALAEVKDGEKVLVAPDEILNLLPMEALIEELPLGELEWEEKGHGLYPKGVKYVGDRRVLSYWQSGSSLTVARRLGKPVEGNQLLAIADPVFDRGDERLQKTQAKTAAGDQLRLMREMTDATSKYLGWARFPRLVNTEKLVERLQGVYGNQMKSLTGLEATESAVKSQSLEQYGAGVVFATHGIVDERVPYLQQAALVMTNPELTGEGEVSDGFLTMTEVMNLKMPTELVGAMACVTGVGGEVAGEGVMNLGRAFQYAGARSVLVSLWSVEAESTSLLGQHVLEAVKDGKPKDQGLLEARQLLRKQGYEHPLFWAGFILVGERDTGDNRPKMAIEKVP